MKKLIVSIFLIMIAATTYGQCGYNVLGNREPGVISAGVLIDWSLRSYRPSGFSGIGVHAGIWADPKSTVVPQLGIFAGYAESKLNENTIATREIAVTIVIRKDLFKDRLVVAGYFSHGTHNYQDIGLRAGFDIWNNGIAVGPFISRTMHQGISVTISMAKKN